MSRLGAALADGEPALPWLSAFAAVVAGEDPAALADDPGVLTRALRDAADLFGLPAVCVSFDRTLEAEALGCQVDDQGVAGIIDSPAAALDVDVDAAASGGRVPAILEATDRLVATASCSVVGGVAEPASLAEALLVDPDAADPDTHEEAVFTAGDACVALANAYLDRGAEGLALLAPDGLSQTAAAVDALVPLGNVVDHFGASGVVVTRELDSDTIETAGEAGFAAVTGRVDDVPAALEVAETAGITLGVGVPGEAFAAGPTAVSEFVASLPAGTLASSEWTVPVGADPEAVHELMGSLR